MRTMTSVQSFSVKELIEPVKKIWVWAPDIVALQTIG